MARIKHPRFQPGRTRGLAGIEFIDGYAEVELEGNTHLAQALAQHGYTVVEAPAAVRPAKASKRSSKGKPAKAKKVSEPTIGAAIGVVPGFAVAETAGESYIPLPQSEAVVARNREILAEAARKLAETPED